MLGATPADEDMPPDDPTDMHPELHDFFFLALVSLGKDLYLGQLLTQ